MPLPKPKPSSWMNSAPPVATTVNMPSACSGGLNAFKNPPLRRDEADPLYINLRSSSNPSNEYGWLPTFPAQNASRQSCRCGCQVISNTLAICPQRPSKPYGASLLPPSTDSSPLAASNIQNEAAPPPNQVPCYANRSPWQPINGMKPAPVSWRPILWPTAVNP